MKKNFFHNSKSFSLVYIGIVYIGIVYIGIGLDSFPGFRATIMDLDDSRATAEQKINTLASIEIISSAFFKK